MNPEQSQALNAVSQGENVFITGSAGTGKSFVIRAIQDYASENERSIMITGMTGISAALLGGRTIHSVMMLGIGKKSADEIFNDIRIRGKVGPAPKLRELQMMVIDEVSMLSGELFEKISDVLCLLRRNREPFGGVQMIFCGDFAQLPPVEGEFCFKSALWEKAIDKTVVLTRLMRQQHDVDFQLLLEKARQGKLPRASWDLLVSRMDQAFPAEIEPTILFATRKNAEAMNSSSYTKLKEDGAVERTYASVYGGRRVESAKIWAKYVDIPESVALCIGAQVVLTANIDVDAGLVNGTRGVVTRFLSDGPEIQRIDGSLTLISRRKLMDDTNSLYVCYIPLQLAWALTIHKSQGMTLDCAAMDLGPSVFAYGQAYTALSRVRSLENLHIIDVAKSSFKLDPCVKEFYKW